MNGGIALNYRAVLFFAGQLRCDPIEIRDDLPEQQAGVTVVRQWPTVRQDGRLPYLDADQILPFIRGEKPEIHDWMACPREDLGQRAFVTVVQGVAMSPQVEDGAFVFVDPDQTPKKGSLVLVLMPYPAVRVLQKEGDMQLLATTGTDWPGDKLTPLPEDAVIAGAVIGKWVPV
ncbi:MAG TPA: S24 family peptidase [Rhodanobacteraceae bacterium]|nr:S24 family peptidase [Rhodanobacteraceae bacterium]